MDAEKPERTKSPYFDGSVYATGTSKSDIKASRFTGGKGAKTSSHESKGQGTKLCQWSLKSFKIPGCPEIQSPDLELVAPPGSKRFNVFTKDGPVPVGHDHAAIDCGKVTKVLTVEDGVNDSKKMCFTGVREEHGIYKRFVEFSGAEELEGFKRYLVSHTTIKVKPLNPHQIDRMFASADETVRRNSLSEPVDAGQEEAYLKSQNSRRSQESIERKHDKERACDKGSTTTTTTTTNGRSRNSTKLISQLQADTVPNETSARTTRGIRRAEGSPDTDSFQTLSVSRTTRSSARTRDEGQDITYVEASPESKKMKLPFRLPDKWKSSLPYPPKGRRVIEVNHEDLYRLNDDEYLNDTLIEFYLAWATDEAEKGGCLASDKVFRFNTFFYTALTKGSNGQKIDYGSVRRWTSKTDIFTYDYLVIPINENYHWYLAIIYNLPVLVRRLKHAKGDDGDQKDDETLSESKKNSAKYGFIAAVHEGLSDQPGTSSDTVKETENSGDAMDVDVPVPDRERTRLGNNGERSMDEDTKDTSLQANGQKESSKGNPKGKKGRKKQPATVKRADLDRPTIILFDSIGQAHTPTARNLKEYLVKEAEVKHGLALDAKVFQTVVAKGIPQQNNVYDCGVFLCLYFEKFINGPDVFVRKLLHKEMDGKRDWPNTDPSKTRRDMLDLLDRLYQESRRELRELKRKRKADKSKPEELLSAEDRGSSGVAKQSSPVNAPEPELALQPRREVHEEASSKSRPGSQEPQRRASTPPGTPPLLRPSPEVMQQSSPPLLPRRKEQKSTGSPKVVVLSLKESPPRDYDLPHPHIPTRDGAPPIFKGIQSLPSPHTRKRGDPSIEYDMEEPVQSVEGMEGVEQGLADDDESMIYNGEDEGLAQEVIDIGDSQPQDDINSKAMENHTAFLLELQEAAAAKGPSRSESASSYGRKNRKQQKQPEVIELDGSQP
ncbi:hypothetical protein B0J12DRAFT_743197 [Macrophomina phaseolina]|uniref:Ubiquitin-like protease family profile domain-containing protein n=1 Tax=Macrophomina phaseolina TaxID=35725 RepID=A0ABQ8G279_9PEZI|nr:hypothetical protein B0J12DRAFT_743197 [Macrophomina phaseolina]